MNFNFLARNKKFIIIAVILFLVLSIAITIATVMATRAIPKEKTVAYIDDLPVSYGEFSLLMGEQRGDVVSYFYDNYHVDESVDFWDKNAKFGGENPLEILKENVLLTLKTKKAEQLLMIEYGIVKVEDLSYNSFQKFWKAENEKRKQTIAEGGVVYGPEEYTEIGYYNYLHNMRKIELREILFKESGSTDNEDRFTNALIDKKTAEMLKDIDVKKEMSVFEKISAVAE